MSNMAVYHARVDAIKDGPPGPETLLGNFEHDRLERATLLLPPCGCSVEGKGTLPSPIRIVFCKAHREARTAPLHLVARWHLQLEGRGKAFVVDPKDNPGIVLRDIPRGATVAFVVAGVGVHYDDMPWVVMDVESLSFGNHPVGLIVRAACHDCGKPVEVNRKPCSDCDKIFCEEHDCFVHADCNACGKAITVRDGIPCSDGCGYAYCDNDKCWGSSDNEVCASCMKSKK